MSTQETAPAPNKYGRFLWLGVKLLLAGFVFAYLARADFLDVQTLWRLAESPLILGIAIVYVAVSTFACAARWKLLLDLFHLPLRVREALLPTFVGQAMSPMLPGGLGGDIVRMMFLLRRFTQARLRCTLSIVLDRISGLLAMVLVAIGCFALYYVPIHHAIPAAAKAMAWLSSLGAVCVVLLTTAYLLRNKIPWPALSQEKGPAALRTLARFVHHTGVMLQRRRLVAGVMCYAMINQLSMGLMLWAVATQMGLGNIPFWQILLASSLAQLIAVVPLTPGGIGVAEAAFAFVLDALNHGQTAAYSSIFLNFRIISMLVYLPGVVIYFTRRDL